MLLEQRPEVNHKNEQSSSGSYTPEFLNIPKKNGKPQPWAARKILSRAIGVAYYNLGHTKRAERMADCAGVLEFQSLKHTTGETHKRLSGGIFCKERLCPMCQALRARKLHKQAAAVVCEAVAQNPKDLGVLMTLTVPNCTGEDLKATDKRIKAGLNTFFRTARIKAAVRGFFWTMEVTFNASTGMYHPHVHILALMRPTYGARNSKLYFDQRKDFEFSRFWGECVGLDVVPVCDIRPLKGVGRGKLTDEGKKTLYEVTKYCVKPDDLARLPMAALNKVVDQLHNGLRGSSLYRFGGEFRRIRRELKLTNDQIEQELTEAGPIPKGYELLGIERYRFHDGYRNFVLHKAYNADGEEVGPDVVRDWMKGKDKGPKKGRPPTGGRG